MAYGLQSDQKDFLLYYLGAESVFVSSMIRLISQIQQKREFTFNIDS